MKKYINSKFLFLSAILVMALSCNTNEQDVEPIIGFDNYPLATFDVSDTDISEAEGGFVTVDINFDKMIDRGVSFEFEQVGGTAIEHEDFEIHDAIVQPYSNTAQLVVEILEDATIEDVETLDLQVIRPSLASKYLIHPDSDLPLVHITIENYVSESIEITFDWGTDLIYDGDAYSSCAYVDLDIFVSDAAGFDINDPWATINWTGYAATGDCPEVLKMDKADWGDGEYIIWHEIYANGYYFLWGEKPVPITTTFLRAGVFKETIVQDDAQAMLSTDPGWDEGGTSINGYIAKVTIAGDTYTISAENGDEIISGKLSSNKVRTPRPDNLNKTHATINSDPRDK